MHVISLCLLCEGLKMNDSCWRLAASFNHLISGSAIKGLLDGSVNRSHDVSGPFPGNPSNVINELPMDQDDTQGQMHPEDFDTSNKGNITSAPPGIPRHKPT